MKAGSRPQYYRIRRMVQMVREGTETGYLPNSSDFIKEFEVSRRTVARDLDFLRDEERAPLALRRRPAWVSPGVVFINRRRTMLKQLYWDWPDYECCVFHVLNLNRRKRATNPIVSYVAGFKPGELPLPLATYQAVTHDPADPMRSMRELMAFVTF